MKLSANEIEVNNILIAEFMEFHRDTEDLYLIDNYNLRSENQFQATYVREMKFHTSWDWLMSVVEKIESLVDEKGCAIYNVVIQQCFVEIIENHTSDEIVNLDRDNKKDAIYDAVVEFIKYYNENNQVEQIISCIFVENNN